jgi:hypothetical protein
MKPSKICINVALFLFAINLYCDSSPFDFLRDVESARAAALAGCFVAMPDDASAVFFNPATVSTVSDKHFSTTFFKHILDINSGNVSYIHSFEQSGSIAAAVSFTNYGSFPNADQLGNINGSFSANNILFSGTYSNELDSNLYYGVSAEYAFINLEKYNSSAFAVSAGLIYLMPEKRTNIGVSVLHAGTQLTTLDGVRETLPLDIRLGVNHRLRGLPLLINFSFQHLADQTNNFFDKFLNFSLAGEFYIGKYVQARLGYNNQVRRLTSPDNNKGLSGFSGGAGVKMKDFNLDYGIAQIGSSALLHRFSLSLEL